MAMNLTDFRSTRRESHEPSLVAEALGLSLGHLLDNYSKAYVYDGYLYILEDNDGKYYLILCNEEYLSDDLPRLEGLLYEYYLSDNN